MNITDTLSGLIRLVEDARAEARRADALMHELNGKLGGPSSPRDLREAFAPVHQEWSDFALATPLLKDREPRMTTDDVRRAVRTIFELKRRGLEVYARLKDRGLAMRMAGEAIVPPNAVLAAPKSRLLRGALIAAALLSGAAAAKVLVGSKKKTGLVPVPVPAPTPALTPMATAMPTFQVPIATLAPMLVPPPMVFPRPAPMTFEMEEDDE